MSAREIADRLIALTDEHGLPNNFGLAEIYGDTPRAHEAMKWAQDLRLQMVAINECLAVPGLRATYRFRTSRFTPAGVHIERIKS